MNERNGGLSENLTLRDYFAGQALIGILGARNGFLVDCGTENAPQWAYDVADAMLKARESSEDKEDVDECPICGLHNGVKVEEPTA